MSRSIVYFLSSSWCLITITIHPRSKLPSLGCSGLWLAGQVSQIWILWAWNRCLRNPLREWPTHHWQAGSEGGNPGELCFRALIVLMEPSRSSALLFGELKMPLDSGTRPCLLSKNGFQYLLCKTEGMENWFSSFSSLLWLYPCLNPVVYLIFCNFKCTTSL